MDESFDENDAKQLEECVKKVISKIKANRNRACFQNIQNFVNRRGKNVEMEKLKQIIEDLTEKNIIVNKGKVGKESFDLIQEGTNLEIPEEKVTKVASDDGESLHVVTEFIDKEFYPTLINRIKLEVKNEIKSVLKR